MSILIESTVMYALGFAGLAAFGLLPYRVWRLLADVLAVAGTKTRRRLGVAVAILFATGAIGAEIALGSRVFVCLTDTYCGPGIASGWIYLAMLGAVYFTFEASGFLLRWFTRQGGDRFEK